MNRKLIQSIKGIIFDLDGTLLNTLEDLAASMNHSLNKLNYPEHDISQYNAMVGAGIHELARRALPEGARDEDTIETSVAELKRHYSENWHKATRPYNGIERVLSVLKDSGIHCAVHSNKPHSFALEMVDYFFPGFPFKKVLGGNTDIPLKPDPEGARVIAELFSLEPEFIAYIGDSDIDMNTARNAGMMAIGAGWGFRGKVELKEAGAHKVLDSPLDIIDFIHSMRG